MFVCFRGRNSLWYGLEADLDAFLRNHRDRYARFTAVLSYPTDDYHILVHRPTAVMLRVRLYQFNASSNSYDQVHLDGRPVDNLHINQLDNVFFSNDPDHTCEPLPSTSPRTNG